MGTASARADHVKLLMTSVQIQNAVAEQDLMDPGKTDTDLIAGLIRAACGPGAGGLGFKLLLTSINSDHGDDSCLGPHSHRKGYAVDIGTIDGTDVGNNSATLNFCLAMGKNNVWIHSIGLGGIETKKMLPQLAAACKVPIFEDNDEPHIHLSVVLESEAAAMGLP